MTFWLKRISAILLLLPLMVGVAEAQLRGHGGPVRAVAISPDGKEAISGSFDTSAIRWSLTRNVALQVMRFHDNAVNAVVWLKSGRIITAGADAKIAIWTPGRQKPDQVLTGHKGPIVGLAVSPDGKTLASASWDHTVRLWPLAPGGYRRVLTGNTMNVNGVAFSPDGKTVISAGYDTTLHIWQLGEEGEVIVRNLPSPLNTVAVAPDGEIIVAGATGQVFFLTPKGEMRAEVQAMSTPVIQVAISPNGKLIAAAGVRGSVAIVDRNRRKLLRTLVGPGLPVWAVAFFPDNRTLLTGGTDRMIRRWDVVKGEPIDAVGVGAPSDPLARYAGDPGAKVFRHCVACHTLTANKGNRAGPSLHNIFGRKIASLPGYHYSEALKHMNIVWTPKTVSKMFEVGPMIYTPGTKMPEQKINSAADRKSLMKFLEKAAMGKN